MEAVLRRRLEMIKAPGLSLHVFVNPGKKEWDAAENRMVPAYVFFPRRSKQCDWNLETVVKEAKEMLESFDYTNAHLIWHALLRITKQPPAFEGDKDIRCNVTLFGAQFRG